MITIRQETAADVAAREALLDAAFGAARFTKTSRAAARGSPAGGRPVVRRGRARPRRSAPCGCGTSGRTRPPGAAARPARGRIPTARNRGIGAALMQRALREASRRGHARRAAGRRRALLRPLRLLGREDRRAVAARPATSATGCSALELEPGALDGARGLINATGGREPQARPRRPARRDESAAHAASSARRTRA